jgi:glycosyltransferase involved in cell wall biosynthesis
MLIAQAISERARFMNKPLVSVVVPVYNGDRYLASALESVLEQDYCPFEIIVVDDGSVDDTAKIARSYEEVSYIYQTNQGPAAARNAGVVAARGEFIAFLDADDLWTANKLSLQMNHLLRHPEVGYVLARQRFLLEPGATLTPYQREALLAVDQIGATPSTWVVRKVLFHQIGKLDYSLRHYEDLDWLARANDAHIQRFVVQETLLHKRIHNSNLSGETGDHFPILLRVLRRSADRRRSQEKADG